MNAKVEKPAVVEAVEYVVNSVKLTDDTKIVFKANPKRNGSAAHGRYEKYQKAVTFGEYRKLNEGKFQMADARHDISKKFLTVNK